MNAEDIFRSSIGCEIMLMIKARIRLIFSRYIYKKNIFALFFDFNPFIYLYIYVCVCVHK